MKAIITLFDRSQSPDQGVLTDGLRRLYGGDLRFPAHSDRPYVIGNFVSTLDGVVSFEIPGKSGGGDISGHDEGDQCIMGLLRASADAVIVGAGTLREVTPDHLWLAEHVYPEARDLYARYRTEVLDKPVPPVNVIVSATGAIDLQRAVFRTPGVQAMIATSAAGKELLASKGVAALAQVKVRAFDTQKGKIASASILSVLRDEFGVRLLLHEGGATLFGDFVAAGCVDELFLTLAPQLAGREVTHNGKRPRPGVIAGTEFKPSTAPWLQLVSVKQHTHHLYLRYARPH